MQRQSIPKELEKFNNTLTPLEERFYEILSEYEICSIVKYVYPQYWIKTKENKYRRIDFVLVINDGECPCGLFIEVDGKQHEEDYETFIDDRIREQELKIFDFPILRFTSLDVFGNSKWVADKIEEMIYLIGS
ncbi:MAG: DUF559 domain-containing protein [Candidatus Omnitrophica bacterium]|nr:DUF559 domain-containing protein [Candidatus Omnitrophota bacterium]